MHDLCDLLRLDEFVRVDIGPHLTHHVRGHTSGIDEMHAYAERLDLLGEHLGEARQGMLG